MVAVGETMASFERNIELQTGKPVTGWVDLVRGQGFEKHGAMMTWLKSDQGLSHSHANHVAKRALEAAAPRSAEDPAEHLFVGGRADLRPIYERLVAAVAQFGPDVEIAPKKANVSIRRQRQFALVQPSTRTRIDLGLILPDRRPDGRLEAAGNFNAMFTHRVRLAACEEIDSEVLTWLREAYDAAG